MPVFEYLRDGENLKYITLLSPDSKLNCLKANSE